MTAQAVKGMDKFKHSENRSEKHQEKMKAELALTATQVSQLSAINTDYAAKMKAAKESSTDRTATRATFKTLRSEKNTAIKGILNSEQLAKYETMKSEAKGKRGADDRHAGTPEERAQKQTARLTDKLGLSEEQTAKVAAINLEYTKKMKATKEASTEKEANREAWKTLRAEQHTAIKAVLTSEQLTTYGALKKERKGKGKRGGDGRKAGTPEERAQKQTARLTEKLGLSEEQTAKVTTINLGYAQKMKATKEASTEKGTNREAWKTLRAEQHVAIKAVLTPAQLTTYESMKSYRQSKRGKGKSRKK